MTAAGIGWVLVDATVPAGRPLDDDQFTVTDLDDLVPRCLAAVRGAAGIAAAGGHRIGAIGVCWSPEVEDRSADLLTALRATGCADVRPVRQVTPAGTAPPAGTATAETSATDVHALLAELFEGDIDFDAADCIDDGRVLDCGPAARQLPAYAAAHLVLTNAVPRQPAAAVRTRREWSLPPLGGRLMTLAGAAAVTAVIALFAVGSQFGGSELPESATLANRATLSTPQTSPIVAAQPPAAQPLAAPAAPVAPQAAPVAQAAPVRQAAPAVEQPVAQTVPTAQWVPPVVPDAAPVVAAPEVVTAPEVVAEAVPHVADPAVPLAAPGPDPLLPAAPPTVVPPAPFPLFAPPAPVPAAPPLPEPAALPAPEAAPPAAPVEPPPPVPVNPLFGALP